MFMPVRNLTVPMYIVHCTYIVALKVPILTLNVKYKLSLRHLAYSPIFYKLKILEFNF